MDTTFFSAFSPSSRVWIYQSDRELNPAQTEELKIDLGAFVKNWTAHNQALKAGFEIRNNRFIVLMVDETQAGASGCSIDASVHFIKNLELKYEISLFNRLLFCYETKEKTYCVTKEEFQSLIFKGEVDRETLVFNNLVRNKLELETLWKVPFKDSWFGDYFTQPIKKETWS